jgi:hypothetical protein
MKFHSQHLKKSVPTSFFKMDTESDRFRQCKNCGKKFMTPHRGRIYCNDFCSDEFNNREKRWKREEASFNSSNSTEEITIENSQLKLEPDDEILQNNLAILESLNITVKEQYINMDSLDQFGYKYSHYTGKGKLYNIDPSKECHFLQLANYRLYRVDFSTLLVVNLNYVLC